VDQVQSPLVEIDGEVDVLFSAVLIFEDLSVLLEAFWVLGVDCCEHLVCFESLVKLLKTVVEVTDLFEDL